jgi:hypothetical protein
MSELVCWNCGASLADVPRPISRHEQCPSCFEALHCCRLCRHYRLGITGQCDEDRADPPVIKENANFCDWFRPSAQAFSGGRVQKRADAEDRLKALFGDDEDPGNDGPHGKADAAGADPDAAGADPDREADSAAEPRSPEAAARARLDDLFSKD